jgi:hypothetical protein
MNYVACSGEVSGTMLQEAAEPNRNEPDDSQKVLGEA